MTQYKKSSDGTIVRDFAQRTLDNLRFIDKQYRLFRNGEQDTEVYEVTQLINSMLGLLVFPKETFWMNLKELPVSDIPSEVCPFDLDPNAPNLRELIRLLRNSFSHFNLDIRTDTGYIRSILMQNKNSKGIVTWQDEVSIFDLRKFIEWFIEGIINSSLLDKPIDEIKEPERRNIQRR